MVLVVDCLQRSLRWWQGASSNEKEDGLFRCKLDSLADHVHELTYGQVGRHQKFFLRSRDEGFCQARDAHMIVHSQRTLSMSGSELSPARLSSSTGMRSGCFSRIDAADARRSSKSVILSLKRSRQLPLVRWAVRQGADAVCSTVYTGIIIR